MPKSEPADPRCSDLSSLIAEVVTEFESGAEISVATNLAATPAVRAERRQISQLVWNLLRHACARDPQAKPRHVSVRCHYDQDETVMLEIEDDGPALADGLLLRVFGDVPGTVDLGLAVCRELVAGASGALRIGEQPGGGVVAQVELRVTDSVSRDSGPSPGAPSPAILAVDDNDLLIRSLRGLFEPYRYDAAASARDAVPLLRQRQYDLVLCDVCMPEHDGIELWESALRLVGTGTFVFMTGGVSRAMDQERLRRTGHRVILKSELVQELGPMLDALAGRG